jgi:hypothetical protein
MVIPCPTQRLGLSVRGVCWAKAHFADFLGEKEEYVNADAHSPPSPRKLLKIHILLYIKHLHSAWVAVAASFHSS